MTGARGAAAAPNGVGDRLMRVVRSYAELGDHRTGTAVDHATVEWFASELAARGGRVERQPYTFPRYDARWEVRLEGEAVAALPLFYEAVGRTRTVAPVTATVPVVAGSVAVGLDRIVTEAEAAGRCAGVIATATGHGLLTALNRPPRLGSGLPMLCVAEALGDRLTACSLEVDVEARIVEDRSANVVATFGSGPGPLTVVATPLSGWFTCAGERGPGIALALELAPRLAACGPVQVVGTTGHELGGEGQRQYLLADPRPPAAVIHLGASIAAGEGHPLQPTSGLWVTVAAGDDRAADVAEALSPLGRPVRRLGCGRAVEPDQWIGEARGWSRWGTPMISLAGDFPLFHTPQDVPDRATSPELLQRAWQAVAGAVDRLAA